MRLTHRKIVTGKEGGEARVDETGKGHVLNLNNRKSITVSGIKAVSTFDPEKIVLETVLGTLAIKGENLFVQKLDLLEGSFVVEGKINSLWYETGGASKRMQGVSTWRRIFG